MDDGRTGATVELVAISPGVTMGLSSLEEETSNTIGSSSLDGPGLVSMSPQRERGGAGTSSTAATGLTLQADRVAVTAAALTGR